MSDHYIPGMWSDERDPAEESSNPYNMTDDELRTALFAEQNKVQQLIDEMNQLKADHEKQRQEETRQQQSEKRRARAEASEFKRATIMVNKKQWEIVRRYCYTHNINQSDFVGQALDMYLQTLNTTRLKKLPPEGIRKGGRPRKER